MKKHLFLSTLALSSLTFATQEFKVWHHATGNKSEIQYIEDAVKRYNSSQNKYKVSQIDYIPEGSYMQTVKAAGLSGKLACVFKVDQPQIPSLAWSKQVEPLDVRLKPGILNKLNDGAKGIYKNHVYSAGQFDVSLAFFAKKSILKKYDIRQATLERPYTKKEFTQILKKLKDSSDFKYPFDMTMGWGGEWAAYAYAPLLQSAGGDLINRSNFQEAEGVLNGRAGLVWAQWFANLFKKGYVNKRSENVRGLTLGDVAIQYIGSWEAPNYIKDIGEDDLAIMPPVDLGTGPKVGNGSWHFAMSSSCQNKTAAADFLNFLLSDKEIAAISNATGLLPTSNTAAKMVDFMKKPMYKKFFKYAQSISVRRPETPAYPTISSVFTKLVFNLRDGIDPQEALDTAVDAIEQDITDNKGYK